jgi:hypothetical protein
MIFISVAVHHLAIALLMVSISLHQVAIQPFLMDFIQVLVRQQEASRSIIVMEMELQRSYRLLHSHINMLQPEDIQFVFHKKHWYLILHQVPMIPAALAIVSLLMFLLLLASMQVTIALRASFQWEMLPHIILTVPGLLFHGR